MNAYVWICLIVVSAITVQIGLYYRHARLSRAQEIEKDRLLKCDHAMTSKWTVVETHKSYKSVANQKANLPSKIHRIQARQCDQCGLTEYRKDET